MSALDGLDVVVAVAVVYAIGLHRMWARVGTGRLVHRSQALLVGAGIVALAASVAPPLDSEVGTNLTLHMTQHVVMIWIAAPLLVAGAPLPTMLWAAPDGVRLALSRPWRKVHARVAGDAWAIWVAGAVALQGVALGIWHLAPLYQAAVRNAGVHALEHAWVLGTAVFFWWTIAGVVRRVRFGAGVLAVFIAKLPGLAIGVGMAIARGPWYSVYGTGAPALHDQQYAGMVMWVAGGSIATLGALTLFALWMHSLEVQAPGDAPLVRLDEPLPPLELRT